MSNGVTFYFMRHGETYLNFFERMQGWANAPLTDRGILDTQRSGRGLANIKFDAVYTSDLMRTIDTANIILAENAHADGLEIIPMQEFREVHFGYFEGLEAPVVWQDIIESVNIEQGLPNGTTEQVEATMNMLKRKDPSGLAENYLEFWNRVESGLLKLLHKHAGTNETVLVVCHGLTIRNLLHGLVADFEVGQEHLHNASVSIVQYREGQFRLLALNQTDHFAD
ncbi:histidine phosphatase family protein [Aerococcaceae bacterium NML191292]|nr:histidine phosphatase family protein [Aerococcaceae bacterium NML191292]MCW6665237.1 histidine phosphatase family protein [Aerococcaceae bacterium NML191219]MCW6680614.1 histidine phosphatase family protein [Aerococcaceae bacterium NML130460]